MSLKLLMQRITSMNGIDIQDSENLRVPAGELRAALAEAEAMRRERDELKEAVGTGVLRTSETGKEVPAAPGFQRVAFSRNGSLFWFGNPQDWLGVTCNLYVLAVSKPKLSCSNENKEQTVWCRCGPEHKCSACFYQTGL